MNAYSSLAHTVALTFARAQALTASCSEEEKLRCREAGMVSAPRACWRSVFCASLLTRDVMAPYATLRAG
jgi:hypothetical protein